MKLILAAMTFGLIIFFSLNNLTTSSHSVKKNLIPPPKNMKLYSFGYDDTIADSLWVRVIQDMHYCRYEGEVTESIVASQLKSTNKDTVDIALTRKLPEPKCQDSWVYHMIEAITDLAPKFKLVYSTGTMALSIIVDDREGAGKIFEKGMKNFPNDWRLAYSAGYHFLFEMQQPDKAARYLTKAAENGAPSWIYSLVGKIYTKTGQAVLAKLTLENFLRRNPEAKYSSRAEQRLIEANRVLGLTDEKPNFKSMKKGGSPGNLYKSDFYLPKYIDLDNPKFK